MEILINAHKFLALGLSIYYIALQYKYVPV